MKIVSAIVASAVIALTVSSGVVAAPPAPNGELIFKQRCQLCHTVAPNAPSSLAPSLTGVVGRKAALTSFTNYSPALRASKITWTKANLDRFLKGPARMVPGTRMVVMMTDPAQRAALITYLSTKR